MLRLLTIVKQVMSIVRIDIYAYIIIIYALLYVMLVAVQSFRLIYQRDSYQ